MIAYEVWLADPAGEIKTFDWGMVVTPTKIRQIGKVEVNKQPFDPGWIYCTQAALDQIGDEGVVKALIPHLLGQFSKQDAEDGFIYNVLPRNIRIVTHTGDHTAVIMSWEY